MIYASIALGLMAANLVDSTEAASGSLRTLSTLTFKSAFDKKASTVDDENEGDEGNEGNEGFEFFKMTSNDGDEGDEGNEGNEGNEGDEGDEGDEGNEGDEGDEGNEGQGGIDCGVWHPKKAVVATNLRDLKVNNAAECLAACRARGDCEAATFEAATLNGVKGCWLLKDLKTLVDAPLMSTFILCPGESGANEGDEGDEGGFHSETSGSTSSGATCTAHSTATAVRTSQNAYILALAESFDLLCHPERGDQIDEQDVKVIWDVPAFATARAIADASGACTSFGTAFGCAKAKSQAAAWAAATAEAHAGAYAEAFDGCGICPNNAVAASASAEVYASTFLELMADVYAQAEIQACVAGNQSASSRAWSNCFASAFARLNAKAMADGLVSGNCNLSHATAFVSAVTDAKYTRIEGCAQGDTSLGNASGSTGGSTAEAIVRVP